jgi:hypothetical protein
MCDCKRDEGSMIQRTAESIDFKSALEKGSGSQSHKSIGIESVITTQNDAF